MVTFDIESPSNRRIVDTAKLKKRRRRETTGRFLIEGTREVERALDAGLLFDDVFIAPDLVAPNTAPLVNRIAAAEAALTTVSNTAFAKLSMRQGPDGIVAVAPTWDTDLDDLQSEIVLVAEGIEKPGNLGAMLRTADAVGAALLIADPTVDPFNPNVVRASQGALFSVPFAIAPTTRAVKWCRSHGKTVVATPDAKRYYWGVSLSGPVSIVIGAEHEGVSDAWASVGTPIKIPMSGAADSLNASVAAALVLFEAARQRI
ncbi:MAG: RNA methyltransferase [Actinomycetota bacterium]